MPDLNNSQRRLYKATYAPIQPDSTQPQTTPSRGLAKGSESRCNWFVRETLGFLRRSFSRLLGVEHALVLRESMAR